MEAKEDNPLIGSWELVSYMDADVGDWATYPETVVYQKHITPTHFTWYRFDSDQDQLVGIGGGTYEYADGVYTENIDFFMPPGSNELGQAIPFTAEMKEGKWYHTGYAKSMEIDETSGEVVMADSSKIEEIWEKVGTNSNADAEVVGSWKLITYREGDKPTALEYPDFIKYIKLITSTHFTWIKYNAEGDEVFEAGAGTYSLGADKYTETVQMMYPPGSGTVGSAIEFTYSLDSGRWNHMGYVNRVNINNDDEAREDLLIDEVWMQMEQ
ncbi:MAG: hypothetical protein RIF33_02840 [Cyclobacteriaceae bacterium]